MNVLISNVVQEGGPLIKTVFCTRQSGRHAMKPGRCQCWMWSQGNCILSIRKYHASQEENIANNLLHIVF